MLAWNSLQVVVAFVMVAGLLLSFLKGGKHGLIALLFVAGIVYGMTQLV